MLQFIEKYNYFIGNYFLLCIGYIIGAVVALLLKGPPINKDWDDFINENYNILSKMYWNRVTLFKILNIIFFVPSSLILGIVYGWYLLCENIIFPTIRIVSNSLINLMGAVVYQRNQQKESVCIKFSVKKNRLNDK